MHNIGNKTIKITLIGVMLAVIMALSFIEHALPPLPFMPPGVRFGLSNIVTMYMLFFVGKRIAFGLAVAKSLFILLIRGVTAGVLSLCGGVLSITVILLAYLLSAGKLSYLILSILGAIAHNLGQIAAASVILHTNIIWYYLPVLIVSGVVMGSITGTLLKVVLPVFDRTLGGLRKDKLL